MQINHEYDINIYSIRNAGPGEIVIMVPLLAAVEASDASETTTKPLQKETLTRSAVIMPNQLIRDWAPQQIDQLQLNDIQQLADLKPELVIIGTGTILEWPDRSLLSPLMEAGIGYEIMDTAAACRTYNVLSYEGREVAAALMMIQEK